ncbi:MAG: hypothetical protein DWQ29_07660 [Planctomycetota bacterium]|nr:MAG: hypothetical protein DWQ29_07660 [Planctomycetota bacterium]
MAIRPGRRCGPALIALVWLAIPRLVTAAEEISLAEPATDQRVKLTACEVHTTGKIYTNAGGGRTAEHDLSSAAAFRFRERRLPPAGRDDLSLRALREFEMATMQTRVADHDTKIELPDDLRLIVARGKRSGIDCYAPGKSMTRDAVELLELPSDPLLLTAMLPLTAVQVGGQWSPSDWAAQMMAGIEAVQKVDLTCTLESADSDTAEISFAGSLTGQRYGANTEVAIEGKLTFDRKNEFIRSATTEFQIKSSVGTINPGIDAVVDVRIERALRTTAGRLTDAAVEAIPLEADQAESLLLFEAPPWNVELRHDRNWYVFQALFEGTPQVAILRLMEQGSLICQCNISPVASAQPGKHTPLEQFEADIQQALGDRFRKFSSREQIPTDDGRSLFRVVAEGEVTLKSESEQVTIPMQWIYYLCADRTGQQLSFVFTIEPAYLELLNGRDVEMVRSLRFVKQ